MRTGSSAAKRLAIVCWLWCLTGCAAAPQLIIPDARGVRQVTLQALLDTAPLAEGENIKALLLGRTQALSYHLVQVRDRERPHVHAAHDLTMTLLRGKGTFYIQGAAFELRVGDVAVVPRGTPHYFVNADSAPAVAFVTFAPPYDGTDQAPVQ